MRQFKILNIWRIVLIEVVPKPEKTLWDPKNYRSISLLCFLFNILKRLIFARVEPTIDPLLSQEQTGFRQEGSTVDQFTLLTQDIRDSYSAKKAGVVFVNLTAAYDTAWHRGLISKLLRLLPDRYMVRMVIKIVSNHSFTLTTGNVKRSRLRHLKNSVRWTGRSGNDDMSNQFAWSWHYASHSWGSLLVLAGVLEQQSCEQQR